MNSEVLFGMALGLQAPWQVRDEPFSKVELTRTELYTLFIIECPTGQKEITLFQRCKHFFYINSITTNPNPIIAIMK